MFLSDRRLLIEQYNDKSVFVFSKQSCWHREFLFELVMESRKGLVPLEAEREVRKGNGR